MVDHGISLWDANASPAWGVYDRFCIEKNVHDGEPFGFTAAFLFSPDYDQYIGDFQDPYDTTSVLANLMVLSTGAPLGIVSSFVSFDEFTSFAWHQDVFNYSGHNESIVSRGSGDLDDDAIRMIIQSWRNLIAIRSLGSRSHRVWTALTYYHYAWTASYSDQKVLNLAIVLELLLAPHHQSETTHQISFNFARLLGRDREERAALYAKVKKLYAIRSRIVHGGVANDDILIPAAAELFGLATRLIRFVVTDPERVQQFESDIGRRALLDGLLFD